MSVYINAEIRGKGALDGAGVTGGFEPLDVGPLKEQYAPLTPGPPLQPPKPAYF